MLIIKGEDNIMDLFSYADGTAVTIGKFDCIHRGHKRIISALKAKETEGLQSLVFTFSGSPRIVIQGEDRFKGRNLITSEERISVLREQGVDFLFEKKFDRDFMNVSAEEFVRFLVEKLKMRYIAVTKEFRFGKENKGSAILLQEFSSKFGFSLDIIPLLKNPDGTVISSSLIRESLKEGRVDYVNEMLGYEYFIMGRIVRGMGMGKRKLSYPTINMLPPDEKLLPKVGVYVTRVQVAGRSYFGMTDIGVKPTVDQSEGERRITVETHIFDFSGYIYDETAKVSFLYYLREEKKFPDLSTLQEQITRDEKNAREWIKENLT